MKNNIMKIPAQWRSQYNLLREYIKSNPEIHIEASEVSIPEHLRDEFYKRFDDVRYAIVDSWSSLFSSEPYILSSQYAQAERKFLELTGLKQVILPVELASFLDNPKGGMIRWIYNRLFELLQGKTGEDDFERMLYRDLAASSTDMFRIGYESWAALCLLIMLEPDEILGVALDDDYVPFPEKIQEISIGRQCHHQAKRIPEFIIHSKILAGHVAFKMPLIREVDFYRLPVEIPTQRILRDRTGDTSSVLAHRMVFLSSVHDLKKIPIFADMHERKINGPDLTIEFSTEHDLSVPDLIRQAQNRVKLMKPRLGGNIILLNNNSNSKPEKLEKGIDIFSVGLNQSKLQPVIEKML